MHADVSTDVVGKYCYWCDMPLEDRRVPLIVDVALIGRTKIIKLHSALWIQVSEQLCYVLPCLTHPVEQHAGVLARERGLRAYFLNLRTAPLLTLVFPCLFLTPP